MDAGQIGVFDSGVGGLSVASELIRQLPAESLLYFGDTAFVPYGGRPLAEVQEFALGICDFLTGRGCKAVVMACNISSAVALTAAREQHPDLPIVGVLLAGARAAARGSRGRIGVLATKGTVDSGAYERAINHVSSSAVVLSQACPAFVPLVEASATDSAAAYDACREALRPLAAANCDTVILGCTHYPFLLQTLQDVSAEMFRELPRFIDPANETALELARILRDMNLTAPIGRTAEHQCFVSGDPESFRSSATNLLGSFDVPVRHALAHRALALSA